MTEKEIIEKLVDCYCVNDKGQLIYFWKNGRPLEEIYGKEFEKTIVKYLTGKRKEIFEELNYV